ncbi:hypothetical protein GCM10023238_16700 [Streptomyces heliomycini]
MVTQNAAPETLGDGEPEEGPGRETLRRRRRPPPAPGAPTAHLVRGDPRTAHGRRGRAGYLYYRQLNDNIKKDPLNLGDSKVAEPTPNAAGQTR